MPICITCPPSPHQANIFFYHFYLCLDPQNSLTFPEEPKTSMEKEAHHLIKSLLTEMDKRLAYDGICKHPFFAQTDWDHLLDGIQNN